MKFYPILFVLFLNATAFAKAPEVACELVYNKTNLKGITEDFKTGNVVRLKNGEASDLLGLFAMEANLRQICDADGGPCMDAYTLSVTVYRGVSQSHLILTVKSTGQSQRYSTGLTVGIESGFVTCDVE